MPPQKRNSLARPTARQALTLLAARKSLMEIISPDILRPLSVSLSLTASVSMEGSRRVWR